MGMDMKWLGFQISQSKNRVSLAEISDWNSFGANQTYSKPTQKTFWISFDEKTTKNKSDLMRARIDPNRISN